MSEFKDLFSKQAAIYRNSRPTYPPELYEFITGKCAKRTFAWDCATGNGQCAIALAEYFDKIIATDASAQQIENAVLNPKVAYSVKTAYNSGLENDSADLITVATAAHWFEIDKFYTETERVLKPGGVLAIWSYGGCITEDEKLNKTLDKLAYEILAEYWSPEIWLIWRDKYRNLPFPYKTEETPKFKTQLNWRFAQLVDYLNSWSGVQNYKNLQNQNPVAIVENDLKQAWGNTEETKRITWHLHMKIGTKESGLL